MTVSINGVATLGTSQGRMPGTLVWLDVTEDVESDFNRTGGSGWLAVSVAEVVSEDAFAVILRIGIDADVIGSGKSSYVEVSKPVAPLPFHRSRVLLDKEGTGINVYHYQTVIVGIYNGNFWYYHMAGVGWTTDMKIILLGYFE